MYAPCAPCATARELRELGKNGQVVIISSSFIGLESAMRPAVPGLCGDGGGAGKLPFPCIWGDAVGQRILKWHEAEGVQFRLTSAP